MKGNVVGMMNDVCAHTHARTLENLYLNSSLEKDLRGSAGDDKE